MSTLENKDEKENSRLWAVILSYAKKRANELGKEKLTIEILLLSYYELCVRVDSENERFQGFTSADFEERTQCGEIIKEEGFTEEAAKKMEELIKEKEPSYLDSINIQKVLFNARKRAEEKERAEVSAVCGLQALLGESSELVKQALGKAEETILTGEEDTPKGVSGEMSGKAFTEDTAEELTGKAFLAELTGKIKRLQSVLGETVLGQEHAVHTFTTGYFQAELQSSIDKSRKKPRATFLFAGPPGVGKTFLSEQIAEVLKLPFKRFDMSEYGDKEASIEFCGSDKVYKEAKAGNVTSFVAANPKSLLLFDEIEKAHISVIYLFLQMLDAGRLRDNMTDEEVSFKDTIIIITTNAGRGLYEESEDKKLSGLSRKTIIKALETDIDKHTGRPLFPAAICSRFASGNVVMFNHMQAHDLREIVKKKILNSVRNIEESFQIKVDVEDRVYSALLFAEGANADARTLSGRAENFVNGELFELFRLVESESSPQSIQNLERIQFLVDLGGSKEELKGLFDHSGEQEVLVFASEATQKKCIWRGGQKLFFADDPADALRIIKENEITVVLIECTLGEEVSEKKYLNIEDMSLAGIEFFWHLRKYLPNLPIYMLEAEQSLLSAEEELSFTKAGSRGVLKISEEQETFSAQLSEICEVLYQQKSMFELAKINKIVTYDTAQQVVDDGKTAQIRLIHFRMDYAIEAEDAREILRDATKPDLKFEDVIGAEDAKEELRFFVDYLKSPQGYMRKGFRTPKGVLLYGPPGTGKTMLAKAMAGESNLTFITAEGGQFLKTYVGEGPQAVHDLFKKARKYAPAILFIDEIDAVAKVRTGGESTHSNEEVLNALLTEMDGFRNDVAEPVFVLAATNFQMEGDGGRALDPALIRRFDRKIYVELPNKEERARFLKRKIDQNELLQIGEEAIVNLALRSTGMSLASLDSIAELALRNAVRAKADAVSDAMLEEAFETFNSGKEKKWDPQLLLRTARHEAGHAFICWKNGETPSYLTIVARDSHGGYMQHGDSEGKALYTREDLRDRVRVALGGRASEIVYYGKEEGISSGASGDLEQATHVAKCMICSYGMDEKLGLGVISQSELASGTLGAEVRDRVNEILQEELARAVQVIEENKGAIDRLVAVLMDKNHLIGTEIEQLLQF